MQWLMWLFPYYTARFINHDKLFLLVLKKEFDRLRCDRWLVSMHYIPEYVSKEVEVAI